MKLRNKLAAITAAAMLAFAGVGFAAWTFTNVETKEVSTINDAVAVGIELKDGFKLYKADNDADDSNDVEITNSNLFLICDAPIGGVADEVLAGHGLYWSTSNGASCYADKIDNVYIKGQVTKDMEDSVEDKTSVVVTFTAEDTLVDTTYISFADMTAPADLTVSNITTAGDYDVKSANFALPVASYIDTPSSISELTAMNTELGTALSGTKLTFTAQIKE